MANRFRFSLKDSLEDIIIASKKFNDENQRNIKLVSINLMSSAGMVAQGYFAEPGGKIPVKVTNAEVGASAIFHNA